MNKVTQKGTGAISDNLFLFTVDPKACDLDAVAQAILQISRIISENVPSAQINHMNITGDEANVEVTTNNSNEPCKSMLSFHWQDRAWQAMFVSGC